MVASVVQLRRRCPGCGEPRDLEDFDGATTCLRCRALERRDAVGGVTGPVKALTYEQRRSRRAREVRPSTVNMGRFPKRDLAAGAALNPYPGDIERPRTRGDCIEGERPCPFVSCRHHLYLDVMSNGSVKLNFPDLEPEQLVHSCSLDLADDGGHSLDQVGKTMNVTRERARQLEEKALDKARLRGGSAMAELEGHEPEECGSPLAAVQSEYGGVDTVDDDGDEVEPERSVFAASDTHAASFVWKLYARLASERLSEADRDLRPETKGDRVAAGLRAGRLERSPPEPLTDEEHAALDREALRIRAILDETGELAEWLGGGKRAGLFTAAAESDEPDGVEESAPVVAERQSEVRLREPAREEAMANQESVQVEGVQGRALAALQEAATRGVEMTVAELALAVYGTDERAVRTKVLGVAGHLRKNGLIEYPPGEFKGVTLTALGKRAVTVQSPPPAAKPAPKATPRKAPSTRRPSPPPAAAAPSRATPRPDEEPILAQLRHRREQLAEQVRRLDVAIDALTG